jgi:sensor histidine kinase regulating citrate/malate metabolism
MSKIIAIFRKRSGFLLKQWLSDIVIDCFITVISELCQNIFEHSLDSGFLAMQTYTTEKMSILRLCISDSGIGIAKSFEKKTIEFESAAHLIEKAIMMPISSKRDYGYGLCQVNSIVESLSGSMFVRSQDASVSAHYKRMKKGPVPMFLKNDQARFNGTQISITLTS